MCEVVLKARLRVVNLSCITDWIENKMLSLLKVRHFCDTDKALMISFLEKFGISKYGRFDHSKVGLQPVV